MSELYLEESGLKIWGEADRDGDVYFECTGGEGWLTKAEAEHLINHLSEVLRIDLEALGARGEK